MAYLVLILLLINIPLGYWLCRRFKVRPFGGILLIGLAQADGLQKTSLKTILFVILNGLWHK